MLAALSIEALGARFRDGSATPSAAARAYLARVQAAEADARFKAGAPRGPLDGVPIALKDVLCTRGIRTTCGSRILEQFVPPYDATVVARLFAAGAILPAG